MKQKLRVTVTALVVVLVASLGFRVYMENHRYESYMSLEVVNDFSKLYSSVASNQQIYDEVLSSESLSLIHVERLFDNNYSIVTITQRYQQLAVQLKRENIDMDNLPASNASSIAYFFKRLIWDIAENEGVSAENGFFNLPYELPAKELYKLGKAELEKVEMVKQLNGLWMDSFIGNMQGISATGRLNSEVYFEAYKDTGITSEYWIKVVEAMDVQTEQFLTENHHIENIKSLLY